MTDIPQATTYLTLADILYIQEEQVRLFGGGSGVRDMSLVQSAQSRARADYHNDLVDEAAALWESLGMNHAFIDGNKRVAFASLDVFLGLNGCRLDVDPDEAAAFIYERPEGGTFVKDRLEAWLRRLVAEDMEEMRP